MNIQQLFVDIIGLALWDCSFEDNQLLLSISNEDWDDMYELSRGQGLSAVFYDGLGKISGKPAVCKKMIKEKGPMSIVQSELRWQRQYQMLITISEVYRQHGIRTLLLKGLGLSLYYPIPHHRECNDIDIYLFGQYEEGNRLAENLLGAKVEKFDMKEDHFFVDGCSFDNHIHFLWPGIDINRELDLYLKSLLQQEGLSRFPNSCILLPPPEFNYLFLISHSYGHFMREGMCLRQMTDIACFLNVEGKKMAWEDINDKLQSFRLNKFSDAILSFIEYYFGLSFAYKPSSDTQLLERMMKDILSHSHAVVYHKSKLEAMVYLAKTAWNHRWCYDAFYDGGFKRYVLDKINNKIIKLCK